jgi:hypothetical protein
MAMTMTMTNSDGTSETVDVTYASDSVVDATAMLCPFVEAWWLAEVDYAEGLVALADVAGCIDDEMNQPRG